MSRSGDFAPYLLVHKGAALFALAGKLRHMSITLRDAPGDLSSYWTSTDMCRVFAAIGSTLPGTGLKSLSVMLMLHGRRSCNQTLSGAVRALVGPNATHSLETIELEVYDFAGENGSDVAKYAGDGEEGEGEDETAASIWPLLRVPTLRDVVIEGHIHLIFSPLQFDILVDSLLDRMRCGHAPLRKISFGTDFSSALCDGCYGDYSGDYRGLAQMLGRVRDVVRTESPTTALQFLRWHGAFQTVDEIIETCLFIASDFEYRESHAAAEASEGDSEEE